MNNEQRKKFEALIKPSSSNWIKDAERRKRWRWITNITDRIHLKYLRIKRKLKTNE